MMTTTLPAGNAGPTFRVRVPPDEGAREVFEETPKAHRREGRRARGRSGGRRPGPSGVLVADPRPAPSARPAPPRPVGHGPVATGGDRLDPRVPRRAWIDLIAGQAAGRRAWFATWVYDPVAPAPPVVRGDVRHWGNRVHRRLLGRHWSKRRDRHMSGVLTTEGVDSFNAHMHGLLHFDAEEPDTFPLVCAHEFRLATGDKGNCEVYLAGKGDMERIANYITKRISYWRYEELLSFFEDL